jgi:hypothetical protein
MGADSTERASPLDSYHCGYQSNDAKWGFFGMNKWTGDRVTVCLNGDEFRDAVSMAGSLPHVLKSSSDSWKNREKGHKFSFI